MMSPSDIEVLLHYHCSPNPHPRYTANAVREATEEFLDLGLIEPAPRETYTTTEGGKVLVEALCATPFPVKRWVMPTKEVK